jgi:hypothetical protein
LFTAYELGPVKLIPFPVHVMLDATQALFLIASPWVFGFSDKLIWPHVTFGLLEMIVVILTRKQVRVEIDQRY